MCRSYPIPDKQETPRVQTITSVSFCDHSTTPRSMTVDKSYLEARETKATFAAH